MPIADSHAFTGHPLYSSGVGINETKQHTRPAGEIRARTLIARYEEGGSFPNPGVGLTATNLVPRTVEKIGTGTKLVIPTPGFWI